jgi:hypothetical protein
MGFLGWVARGFGWGIGGELARDAYTSAKKVLTDDKAVVEGAPTETIVEGERTRTTFARSAESDKKRAKEAARREREIDRELAALKKRVGRR